MNPFIESQTRNGQNVPQQNPSGNLINDFNNFRRSFTGDPKAMINQLISSGKVSQEQYNNAVAMANQMKSMFGM